MSQNSENVMHIKRRLLDQAVIVFNCIPIRNWNFSLRKKVAPRESEFFPLRAVPFGMKKDFLYYVICLECVQFSVCMCENAYWELC